ncbi:uncharacterized protein BJX67DRAFT_379605 [Aspergillus lucknowensis]|uniref:Secreted protein n=1 Tax=Aspergillus lucknowensis TaxID=176173 RepID=A0ABR4LX91_9EURO
MTRSLPKTILLAATLATSALGAVQVEFNRYFEAGCTTPLGAATVTSGFCVNVEGFPIVGWDAVVTSGACEDSATRPVLKVFAEPGCNTGLESGIAVGAEPRCVEQDITIQSVAVSCE